jgi:hypothetical protein
MKVGFAEIDITPPLGTRKIGWLKKIIGDRVLDPLYARAMTLESADGRIAVVQMDVLSIGRQDTADIRRRIQERYGFPGANILVAATHNHAGPATANIADGERDARYVESMVQKILSAFGQALEHAQEAEVGLGSVAEFNVAFNRRVVMRDGSVKTHGNFNDPNALFVEGPIDPEVAVLAARSKKGELLGVLMNFSCHPTHHGDSTAFSAGWPGALADEMKRRGCPHTVYVNGSQGNLHTVNPGRGGADTSMEEVGRILADDIEKAVSKLAWRADVKLASQSRLLQLPYRRFSEDEAKGKIDGAQRFVDPTLYDKHMPALLEEIKARGAQPAEVQVLSLDEYAFVGIPAELFCQVALHIKERAHPRRALIFGLANGMLGYVPHKEAFQRGGYETTFCGWSKLAPEAGDLMADAALAMIRS